MKRNGDAMEYLHLKVVGPVKHVFASLGMGAFEKGALTLGIGLFITFVDQHLDALAVLGSLVIIDQIFGTIVALRAHKFKSGKFYNGLLKLLVYTLLVTAFHLIGALHIGLASLQIDTIAIVYLAVTEVLSIVENFALLTNLKLPKSITSLFKVLGKIDEADSDKGGHKR